MKGLLDYDGYLAKILTNVMYVVSLNFLFLLCSLPIITIGSSCTAMYVVLLQYLQGDEPNILKGFFKAFCANLKKTMVIWCAMLLLGVTLGMNYYFLYQNPIAGGDGIRWLLNLVALFLAVLWVYVFPAAAYFENSIRGYLTFCSCLAVAKLPWTVLLVGIQTLPILILLFLAQYLPMATLLLLCCGISLPAFFSGKILLPLFKQYEG